MTNSNNVIDSVGRFTSVDGTGNPRWFIDFMDSANRLPDQEFINRRIAEAMEPLHGKRILEFGCGTGNDIGDLLAHHPEISEVVGVDLSETMIAEAASRLRDDQRVRLEQANGTQLGFENNSFDAARTKLVLMHCEDIDSALAELIRVVKPNGRIVVYDHDFDGLAIDHPDPVLTRDIVTRLSDKAKNGWSGRQLLRRFLDQKLVNVSVEPISVRLTFDLLRSMILGQDTGALSDAEQAWWRTLEQRNAERRFFASFAGFLAVGTKSPSHRA